MAAAAARQKNFSADFSPQTPCACYDKRMSVPTLANKLIVAISSRALFDFEAENRVFEQGDDREYMKLQRDLLDEPAKPGVAYSLIKKLLAFNGDNVHRVEVVVLSRNDPVSGLRVFKSAKHANLPLERGVFTR